MNFFRRGLWFAGLALALQAPHSRGGEAIADDRPPASATRLVSAELPSAPAQPLERLPEVPGATRIAVLEARLAEVEALLRKQQAPGAVPAQSPDEQRTAERAPASGDAPDKGYVVGSDMKMTANWKNGLELQSAHKDFRVHIGGRTQFDGVWLHGGPDASVGLGGDGLQDAVDFRRARLRIDGTMYETIEWAVEYDFVNSVNLNTGLAPITQYNVANVPAPTDLWWGVKGIPWIGTFRAGNQKEPIGLEHLASSRYLDFMERSYNQDAFTGPFNNGFSPGLLTHNWTPDENATVSLGVFKNAYNVFGFGTGDGEYAADGRVTWTPWYDEPSQGRYLLHLGAAASYRALDDGRIRLRARPSLRNGPSALNPVLVDTGVFSGSTQTLAAAEAAVVLGSLLVQGEYIGSFVDDAVSAINGPQGTIFNQGWYVEALYFLTGEHNVYDRHAGGFGRVGVVPHENASLARGPKGLIFTRGAWQLGARYSKLDLRDKGIDGGVTQDVTLGLNWFWNPNMKVQFNYVWTHRNAPGGQFAGDINGAGVRFAHDF